MTLRRSIYSTAYVIDKHPFVRIAYEQLVSYCLEKYHDILMLIGLTTFYSKVSDFIENWASSTLTERMFYLCLPEWKASFDAYFSVWRQNIGILRHSVMYKDGHSITCFDTRHDDRNPRQPYKHFNWIRRCVDRDLDRELFAFTCTPSLTIPASRRIRKFVILFLFKNTKLPAEIIRDIVDDWICFGSSAWIQSYGETLLPPVLAKKRRLVSSSTSL